MCRCFFVMVVMLVMTPITLIVEMIFGDAEDDGGRGGDDVSGD